MNHEPDNTAGESADAEEVVDDLARRAGASLRRPASEQGAAAAMRRGSAIRARRAAVGVGLVGVLALGTVLLLNRGGDDSVLQVVDQTITVVASTTAASPKSTVPVVEPGTSDPVAPVTEATTTTSTVATTLGFDANRWMLEYTGGTAGEATGVPFRIGLGTTQLIPYLTSAAKFVNSQLGGVGGRPIELVACQFGSPAAESKCATDFANDPSISLVISDVSAAFLDALGPAKPRFGGFVHDRRNVVSFGGQATSAMAEAIGLAKVARREAGPDATKVVLVNSPGTGDRYAPWLPGVELIVLDQQALKTDELVAALTAANAVDADAFILPSYGSDCFYLYDALKKLGVSPVVVGTWCSREWDGWYSVGWSYNGDDPSVESGAAALHALPEFQVAGGVECNGCDVAYSDLLTAVKIIHDIGGPDAATPEVLRQALLDFKGPALLWGEQDCSLLDRSGPEYVLPLTCQKTLNVVQRRRGKFVTIDPIDISTP